jgi:hypothetical protein
MNQQRVPKWLKDLWDAEDKTKEKEEQRDRRERLVKAEKEYKDSLEDLDRTITEWKFTRSGRWLGTPTDK